MDIKYADDDYRKLMADYKGLRTFSQVKDWDQQAQAELEKVTTVVEQIEAEVAESTQTLERQKQARQEKAFLSRLVSSKKDETELEQRIRKYKSYIEALTGLAE
jgi:hypothetical protein